MSRLARRWDKWTETPNPAHVTSNGPFHVTGINPEQAVWTARVVLDTGETIERDYHVAASSTSDIRVDACEDILHYGDESGKVVSVSVFPRV